MKHPTETRKQRPGDVFRQSLVFTIVVSRLMHTGAHQPQVLSHIRSADTDEPARPGVLMLRHAMARTTSTEQCARAATVAETLPRRSRSIRL